MFLGKEFFIQFIFVFLFFLFFSTVSLLQNKKFLQWYEANIPKEEQVTYLLSSSSSSAPSPPSDPIFLMDAMYRSSSQDLSQLIKKEGEKKEEERDVGYGWWRRIHASASSSVRRMLGGWQGEERRREEVEECGWEFSFFGRPRIGTFVENMRKEALPYHGFGPEMPPPPPLSQSEVERLSLPLNVLVKSTTESMTHEYYAALRQGKVFEFSFLSFFFFFFLGFLFFFVVGFFFFFFGFF